MQRVFLLWSILLTGFLVFTRAVPAGAGPPYQVSAWTFGDNASLVKACDRQAIDEVDVDCYFSRANGRLGISSDENPDFVAQAHTRVLRVLATVSNWNEALGDFDPNIAGIAIWRMGGETPKFWNEIVRQIR